MIIGTFFRTVLVGVVVIDHAPEYLLGDGEVSVLDASPYCFDWKIAMLLKGTKLHLVAVLMVVLRVHHVCVPSEVDIVCWDSHQSSVFRLNQNEKTKRNTRF